MFLLAPALAAEINLEPAQPSTEWDALSADYLLVDTLVQLGVTDEQLNRMVGYLDRVPDAVAQLEQERQKALLYARENLVRKWNLMMQGQEVPQELDRWLDQVMANVAARESRLAAMRQEAFAGCASLLTDQQRLMVAWSVGGPSDVERAMLLQRAQAESQRLQNTVIGLLAPQLERIWLLVRGPNRDSYFRLRASLARSLLNVAVAQGMLNPYTLEYDLGMQRLYELFWDMRTMTGMEFQANLPQLAALTLQAMGVSPEPMLAPQPVITEEQLRMLLLRPETVDLLRDRLAAVGQMMAPESEQ